MNKKQLTLLSILLPTLILGSLLYTTDSNLFLTNTVALWIIAWIYLVIFYRVFTFGFCIKKKDEVGVGQVQMRVITLFISMGILLLFPYKYGRVLTNNYIEKMRYQKSQVTLYPETEGEISIVSIKVNGKDYNIYEIPLDNENWVFNEGKIYNNGYNMKPLTIGFDKGTIFDIKFAASLNSGRVIVKDEEYSYTLDLCSDNNVVYINWEDLYGNVQNASSILRVIYYIAYLFLIWSLVDTVIIVGLAKHKKKKAGKITRVD